MVTEEGLLKALDDAVYLYRTTGLYEYVKIYLDAANTLRHMGYRGEMPSINILLR